MILATFYPFSQTPFFQGYLGHLPWPQIMVMVTVILSVLLMSHVPYAVVPRISFRTRRGLFNMAWMLTGVILAITVPRYYFFPALVLYTSWGLGKSLSWASWTASRSGTPFWTMKRRRTMPAPRSGTWTTGTWHRCGSGSGGQGSPGAEGSPVKNRGGLMMKAETAS
jgi:hypothetical protein